MSFFSYISYSATGSVKGFRHLRMAVLVLLSRNKSTKNSPLKRRDGSVWRGFFLSRQILTCHITSNYFYEVVKICMNSCNQPPAAKPTLTSLLSRGGLPLTICIRAKFSPHFCSSLRSSYIRRATNKRTLKMSQGVFGDHEGLFFCKYRAPSCLKGGFSLLD